jgi:patatin-like phospholipase/acyl hydrolase
MPDYQQGKIYKLYINDLVYIGSTAQPRLSMRLGQHKSKYKQWVKNRDEYVSSFELFKVGTPTIELIELFPCGSKDELRAREGYHQRANNCVNKNIAGRSKTEYGEAYREANRPQIVEKKKVYYEANRPHILERQKAYKEENQQQILEQAKVYYAANLPHIGEQQKQYYVANRQQILEQRRTHRATVKRTERLTLFIQKHIRITF